MVAYDPVKPFSTKQFIVFIMGLFNTVCSDQDDLSAVKLLFGFLINTVFQLAQKNYLSMASRTIVRNIARSMPSLVWFATRTMTRSFEGMITIFWPRTPSAI